MSAEKPETEIDTQTPEDHEQAMEVIEVYDQSQIMEMESFEDEPQRPSKTQRKKAAQALTDLGRQLVELKPQQLARLSLPDDVAEAVAEARAIRSHGARKRQLQFLGKLLRQIDVDLIQSQLARLLAPGRHEVALAKQGEQWRERLLTEGPAALTAFLEQFPQADRQQLRQLIRQYAQHGEKPKGKQAFKSLYREVHQLLNDAHEAQAQQPNDDSDDE
ncbi:MAG: DUF615 domain-containing protein [Xanthomonadales bacterium]|nr:DUF615 domain-containing protein [Xanthomonadales bacterium]